MFDPAKLKDNALTSIRLGVEDFTKTQSAENADPGRALSAVRNLFAGLLLLFKYRISSALANPGDGAKLIFNTGEIVPHPDGKGGVEWKPIKYRSTTIDVPDIKKRFESFGIDTDWKVVEVLQQERNHIEHLHPASAVGVIGKFVADTFPVLREFIEKELKEAPAELLGDTWQIMLTHHDFFDQTQQECYKAWNDIDAPEKIKDLFPLLRCEKCNSPLIRPSGDENEHPDLGAGEQTYTCVACSHRDLILPLLEESLIDHLGGYDPYDGEDPPTAECPECMYSLFVHADGECYMCGYELTYTECAICGEGLSVDEQDNNGLCSYHHYVMEREADR